MQGSATHDLTMILGAAALLLWGVRMAQTGVMRIYGLQIRKMLPRALNNKVLGLFIGAGASTILQSSIAVAIFTASLAEVGAIQVADGLLLMLGADVGSAVVAALLTLNLKGLWPILMFFGYLLHTIYYESSSYLRQVGRILLGLAMILIALTFMGQISATLSTSALVKTIISSLGEDLILGVLLFAIMTWIAHSSIAILLFWASLVQAGITTDPSLIIAAILGINLGNALPPIIMMWGKPAASRQIVMGNALFKFIGILLCFSLISFISQLYGLIPGEASFRVVILHISFNTLLVFLFYMLVEPTAKWLSQFFVDPVASFALIRPKYIPSEEPGGIIKECPLPVSALSREVLRILGTIQNMMEVAQDMVITSTSEKSQEVLKMEDKVNVLFKAVRAYAIGLMRKEIDEADRKKVTALLRYTASLENIGDVICKSIINVPVDMKKEGKVFSAEGKDEIDVLFKYLIGNAQIAAEVIMVWTDETARSLLNRKRNLKKMCAASTKSHVSRLSLGVENSLESSTIHLDLISDMRWINTQVSSIAYDVLPDSEGDDDDMDDRRDTHSIERSDLPPEVS